MQLISIDCVQNCLFPNLLKLTKYLNKVEEKTWKKKHRPVSILQTISNVFERLLDKQIIDYMGPHLSSLLCILRKSIIHGSKRSMYADDTSICHKSFDIAQLNEAINSDLAQVEKWLKSNRLSLNVMITHAMLIPSKPKHEALENQSESLKLKIRNDELDVVQKTKYLGVKTDSKLDWEEHIKTVSSKVSRAIGFLKYAKSFLPEKTLRTMQTGIFEPHFCYFFFCLGLLWFD